MPEDVKTIIEEYLKIGPFESAKLTKKRTEENSKELKDAAWNAGNNLLKEMAKKFYNFPPNTKYLIGSPEWPYFSGLLAELMKNFQITFRLAEEGYYRIAMASLRDILENILMIKFFYQNTNAFHNWISKGHIYTTEMLRKDLFKGTALFTEIENFSNSLSKNRHAMMSTLDSFGKVLTNVPYYRKDLFEKWSKHMIMLKDLGIKIINS